MKKSLRSFCRRYQPQIILSMVVVALYLIMLYSQRHFLTGDTTWLQMPWWDYLLQHGWSGIATPNGTVLDSPLADPGVIITGDYTTVWYAIIVFIEKIGLYPHFNIEICIKMLAVLGSISAAVGMFFIAKHFRPKSQWAPTLTALATLFLPAFMLDVLKTNLPDSIYLSFMIWSFLCFIKNKPCLAWLLLGFGACFKLMAVYLAPFYLYWHIKNWRELKSSEKLAPLWAGFAVVVCSIPNKLAGGGWLDGIINPVLNRGEQSMNLNGINLWSFLPNSSRDFTLFSLASLTLVALLTAFFVFKYIKRSKLTEIECPVLLILSPMLCYFILPAQHEGYFAFASVAAVIALVVRPQKPQWIIAMLLNLLLLMVWAPFGWAWIYRAEVWPWLPLVFLGIITYLYYQLYLTSIFHKKQKCVNVA